MIVLKLGVGLGCFSLLVNAALSSAQPILSDSRLLPLADSIDPRKLLQSVLAALLLSIMFLALIELLQRRLSSRPGLIPMTEAALWACLRPLALFAITPLTWLGLAARLPLLHLLLPPYCWWSLGFAVALNLPFIDLPLRANTVSPKGNVADNLFAGSSTHRVIGLAAGLLVLVSAWFLPRLPGLRQADPTGDEPEYFLVMHSLLKDRDIDLSNNSADNDGRYFSSGRATYPYRYPVHNIGLPVLALPFYWLGYTVQPEGFGPRWAVYCFMALWGWLLLYLMWSGVRRQPYGMPATLAVFGTAPVFYHWFQFYPEIPAAALLLWLVLRFARNQESSARARLTTGLALGLLPWLHIRYGIFWAILGGLSCWRLGRSVFKTRHYWQIICFIVPNSLSIGGLALLSFYLYQTPYFWSAGGSQTRFELLRVPERIIGLLADVDAGLLPVAPIFIVAFYSLLQGAFRRVAYDRLVVVLIVPYLGLCASHELWWGNWSIRGRFLVCILPLLVVPLGRFLSETRNKAVRGLSYCLILYGLLMTWWSSQPLIPYRGSQPLLYLNPLGAPSLFLKLSSGLDLSRYYPSFLQRPREAWTVLGVWVITAVLLIGALRLSRKFKHSNPQYVMLGIAALLCGVLGSLAIQSWTKPRGGDIPDNEALKRYLSRSGATSLTFKYLSAIELFLHPESQIAWDKRQLGAELLGQQVLPGYAAWPAGRYLAELDMSPFTREDPGLPYRVELMGVWDKAPLAVLGPEPLSFAAVFELPTAQPLRLKVIAYQRGRYELQGLQLHYLKKLP